MILWTQWSYLKMNSKASKWCKKLYTFIPLIRGRKLWGLTISQGFVSVTASTLQIKSVHLQAIGPYLQTSTEKCNVNLSVNLSIQERVFPLLNVISVYPDVTISFVIATQGLATGCERVKTSTHFHTWVERSKFRVKCIVFKSTTTVHMRIKFKTLQNDVLK